MAAVSARRFVFKGNVSAETFELARTLTQESSLRVTGTVKADTRARASPAAMNWT